MKNIIIGLDAADWDVMKPLLKSGKLPNISRLMMEGSFGKTKSYTTYGSPALWATIETGKTPPRHGIQDFFTTTRFNFKSKRLFEILEPEIGKVGLYKWFCTWPPKENNGFTVPCWLARSYEAFPREYSFLTSLGKSYKPSKLIKTGIMSLKTGIRINTLAETAVGLIKTKYKPNNLDKIISDNFNSFKIHSEAFIHLLKKYKPNFSAYLISLVDSIGHRFWKYREPQLYPDVKQDEIKKYGRVIDDAYVVSDFYIGKILRAINRVYKQDNINILLVSDHGQKSIREEDDWGYFPRTGSLLEILDLTNDVTANNIGNFIYIRPKSSKYNMEKIKTIFENIKTVNGRKVFLINNIEKDLLEVRINKLEKSESDIIINGNKGTKLSDFASPVDRISGGHAEHGIMILKSSFVKRNYEWKQIYNIEDITPTILYLNGKPIGEDMDGSPLLEIFIDEFVSERPVEFIYSYDESKSSQKVQTYDNEETDAIKEKLKDLGYYS